MFTTALLTLDFHVDLPKIDDTIDRKIVRSELNASKPFACGALVELLTTLMRKNTTIPGPS